MRRVFALFALLVTTWSNVSPQACAWALGDGDAAHEADAADHHGDHATHGAPNGRAGHLDTHHGGDAPTGEPASHPQGDACGIAMACGGALRSVGAATTTAPITPRLVEIRPTSSATPSTADLSQDPPPPRRLA